MQSIQLMSMAFHLFPNRGDGNLPAVCQAIRLLWKTWLWIFTDPLHRPLWKERLYLWLRLRLGREAYCEYPFYLPPHLRPALLHSFPCQTFCLNLWGEAFFDWRLQLSTFSGWCYRLLLLELGSGSNFLYMFLRLWPVCQKRPES